MAEELSLAERKVLVALHALGDASPQQVAERTHQEGPEVMNAASWLRAKGLVQRDEKLHVAYALGPEGQAFQERGLPERRLVEVLARSGGAVGLDAFAAAQEFQASPDEVKIATGQAKRKGLIDIGRDERGKPQARLTERGRGVAEGEIMPDERLLEQLGQGEVPEDALDAQALRALLDRQNVLRKREHVAWGLRLTPKGKAMAEQGVSLEEEGLAQLTPELLQSRGWQGKRFRPYDVTTYAPDVTGGKRHPLRRIIDDIRAVFLEMGFEELEGPFVHTTFWDMDALFIPQDHPAREMQDTFYLQEPARRALPGSKEEGALLKRVAAVHEDGGKTGSKGWGYAWDKAEAEKLLLRTHTTVETVWRLAAQPEGPVKAFVVGRVFRKEAMDATHLPEFHQVDGIVMEEGANLRMLIGLLKEFYAKMGFEDVQVRPSYYPYTEPSLDVAVRWNQRWLELGGAGIFRPEVTAPLGVKHPVLAWGLGLERLAMLKLGLKDIRELYLSDLEWLRRVPAKL